MATEPMPEYHRTRCAVCGVLCEQRRRSVLFPDGQLHVAYECLECEAIYLPAEPEPEQEPAR